MDLLKFLAARPGQDSFQQVLFVRAGLSGILTEVNQNNKSCILNAYIAPCVLS